MTALEAVRGATPSMVAMRAALLSDAHPAARKAAIALGLLAVLGAGQAYNGSVTRTLRSVRRSVTGTSVAGYHALRGRIALPPAHSCTGAPCM